MKPIKKKGNKKAITKRKDQNGSVEGVGLT
jgi:hypothetical protein